MTLSKLSTKKYKLFTDFEFDTGLPKYVKLGKSCLGLSSTNNGFVYYRDAGQWEVSYKIVNGILYSVSNLSWLNNIELVQITEKEYLADNEGYV